ncbi:MAG: alpha/beta hydrolase [Lachnospiraceae bacterium]|nr:alpha/beta hydrolase [Lachnospiraceae bacterium]
MKIIEYGTQNPDVIMLLHGGGLSWWNFRIEAELLCGSYHVVLPVLDGHAESDADFVSIEENARRIISHIEGAYGGSVLAIGGLSLGAQILVEILAQRPDTCRYAVIESASVIPSRITHALIGPTFSSSSGLIKQEWFAKMQFKYLRMRDDLFEDYFRDTAKITKGNMISFLKANTSYAPKPELRKCRAKVRVVVGGKEQKDMLRSARLLHEMLPGSTLEVKEGLYHGEYSINHPEKYAAELCAMMEA